MSLVLVLQFAGSEDVIKKSYMCHTLSLIKHDYDHTFEILCDYDYDYDYTKMCNQLQSITISIGNQDKSAIWEKNCTATKKIAQGEAECYLN